MGAGLSSPVELIRVQRHGSDHFRCGVAEMQGWRNSHEDAHAFRCGEKAGAFWVLDGHGGDGASNFGAPELAKEFETEMKPGSLPEDSRIEQGMMAVDAKLKQFIEREPDKQSGSTVVGALATMQPDGSYTVKLINCGDSRAIVVRGVAETEDSAKAAGLSVPDHLTKLQQAGGIKDEFLPRVNKWPLIQETVDHKPSHPTEKGRIEAAGGHVTEEDPPRLDGNLAVSRGLGDFEYKSHDDKSVPEQKVSCIPDIYEVTGIQPGALCVLCCDGVWDVMTGNEVGCLVRDKLTENPEADLGDIAADIVKTSLDKSSKDNVTAMVIQLNSGADWATSPPPDEMKCFEKLLPDAEPKLEKDMHKEYLTFLRRSQFPPEPYTCVQCSKWYIHMMQCGCKNVIYCSKQCQKKHWKKHKTDCPATKSTSSTSPAGGAGAKVGKKPSDKKK